MKNSIDNDTVRFAYESATGIHICRRRDDAYNVGQNHVVYEEGEWWVIGRRWSTYDTGTGYWDGGVDEVDESDGGGRFKLFETALRVALSIEFEERLSRAFAEIGELEQLKLEKEGE